jgi:hypothetical protein
MASPDALERRWGELAEIAALMQPGDDPRDPLDREIRSGPQAGWAAGLSAAAGSVARSRRSGARVRDEYADVHSDGEAAR